MWVLAWGTYAGAATLAAGGDHTCAISSRAVWCWGDGEVAPVRIPGTDGATAVTAGEDHTCALLPNGAATCFRLGGAGGSQPVSAGKAKGVAAGDELTCTHDGRAVGCVGDIRTAPPPPPPAGGAGGAGGAGVGYGVIGRLGGPPDVPRRQPPPSGARQPVDVPSAGLVAGDGFACGLDGGVPTCAGYDLEASTWRRWTLPVRDARQLAASGRRLCLVDARGGVGCAAGSGPLEPVAGPAGPLSGVDQVAVGAGRVCARIGGDVWCTARYGGVATEVPDLDDAIEITVGGAHACATRRGGGVVCWGEGPTGALGSGVEPQTAAPVTVPGVSGAVSLAAGPDYTCVARRSGPPLCWGDGPVTGGGGPGRPGEVLGVSSATGVVGGDDHACAIGPSGVSCWGGDAFGQLGDGVGRPPGRVVLPGSATALAVGDGTSCAVVGGRPWCWGDRLGDVGLDPTDAPEPIPLDRVTAVSVGFDVACAARDDGSVWCWGDHHDGLLGAREQSSPVPVRIDGLSGAVGVAVGDRACAWGRDGAVTCWDGEGLRRIEGVRAAGLDAAGHTCAWDPKGKVACWGWNTNGELGVSPDEVEESADPIPWTGGAAAEVSTAASLTCVRHPDGAATCFGRGAGGVLGDGELIPSEAYDPWDWETGASAEPITAKVRAPPLVDLDAGGLTWTRVCGATRSGDVFCWGEEEGGVLRDAGRVEATAVPTRVTGLPGGVVDVGVGSASACARTRGGEVWCWGDPDHGVLGDGSPEGRRTAVAVRGLPAGIRQVSAGGNTTCGVGEDGTWCWGWNPVHDDRAHAFDDPLFSGVPGRVGIAGTPDLLEVGPWTVCAAASGSVDCFGMAVGGALGPDPVEIPPDQRWSWPAPPAAAAETPSDPRGVPPEIAREPALESLEAAGVLGALSTGSSLAELFSDGSLSDPGLLDALGGGPSSGFGEEVGEDFGGGLGGLGGFGAGLSAGLSGEDPSPASGSAREERKGPSHATQALDLVQLSSGELGTCGVKKGGALVCWGRVDDPDPFEVAGGVAQVAVGHERACFVRRSGTVACWTRAAATPVDLPGLRDVAEVAVGADHACARRTDGTVACWGDDRRGQLGRGVAPISDRPVPVRGLD